MVTDHEINCVADIAKENYCNYVSSQETSWRRLQSLARIPEEFESLDGDQDERWVNEKKVAPSIVKPALED